MTTNFPLAAYPVCPVHQPRVKTKQKTLGMGTKRTGKACPGNGKQAGMAFIRSLDVYARGPGEDLTGVT